MWINKSNISKLPLKKVWNLKCLDKKFVYSKIFKYNTGNYYRTGFIRAYLICG